MKLKTNLIQFVCAGTINATFKAGGPNVTRTELSVIFCIPHTFTFNIQGAMCTYVQSQSACRQVAKHLLSRTKI